MVSHYYNAIDSSANPHDFGACPERFVRMKSPSCCYQTIDGPDRALQQSLEIDLHAGRGVLNIKVAKNFGVEDTERPDLDPFAPIGTSQQ